MYTQEIILSDYLETKNMLNNAQHTPLMRLRAKITILMAIMAAFDWLNLIYCLLAALSYRRKSLGLFQHISGKFFGSGKYPLVKYYFRY
jgi:hypothetical protein